MVLGAFIVTGAPINILVLLVAGIVGYVLRKLDVPLAPIALTMVLGSILEENLVRALLLADGNVSTLVGSPFSATLMALAFAALIVPPMIRVLTNRRGKPFLDVPAELAHSSPSSPTSDVANSATTTPSKENVK
jgi:putative tricarboxylic transport membrane protein